MCVENMDGTRFLIKFGKKKQTVNHYPPDPVRQEFDNYAKKVNDSLKKYSKAILPELIKLGKDYHRYVYYQWLFKKGMPSGLAYLISKWISYSKVPSMGMMLGELEENK